ncbi:50S ribosomal protein L14 [Candidatus Vidania fulgoroideorum]
MIQPGTFLKVLDNSGAKKVFCIRLLFNKKKYSNIGDIIKVSVKKSNFNGKIKKGSIYNALIVNSIYGIKRKDGTYVKFKDNSVIMLNNNFDIISSRILGIIPKEFKNTYFSKAISISKYVI